VFITRNFMNWLREHADRTDRPYRIVKESPDLVQLEYVRSAGTGAGGGGRPGGAGVINEMEGMGAPLPRAARTIRRRPIGGMADGRTTGMNTGATTPSTLDLSSLLPDRPLGNESREDDYRFTVVWTIELTRPDDARRSEDKIRRERAEQRKRQEELEKAKAEAAARKAAQEAKDQAAAAAAPDSPPTPQPPAAAPAPTTGGNP
jgi:hypothetical protein